MFARTGSLTHAPGTGHRDQSKGKCKNTDMGAWGLLRRDPVNTLLHFTNKSLHAIPNTLRLNTNAALTARSVHARATTPAEADVDAAEVQVQRRHVVRRLRWRLEHRGRPIDRRSPDHLHKARAGSVTLGRLRSLACAYLEELWMHVPPSKSRVPAA